MKRRRRDHSDRGLRTAWFCWLVFAIPMTWLIWSVVALLVVLIGSFQVGDIPVVKAKAKENTAAGKVLKLLLRLRVAIAGMLVFFPVLIGIFVSCVCLYVIGLTFSLSSYV